MHDIKQLQMRAIIHGSLGILVGLFSGVALTYSALSEVSLWPIYSTGLSMPGDVSLWRAAHSGSLMNGTLCICLALCLSQVKADIVSAKRIGNALAIMVWGNIIFYIARIWGTNRGLALKSQQFGDGNTFDALAMIPAFIAMFFTFYAVAKLIQLAKNAHSKEGSHA